MAGADVAALADEAPSPDLRPFLRQSESFRTLGPSAIPLGIWGQRWATLTEETHPGCIPFEVLDHIGFDPTVKITEGMLTFPLADAALYYLEHPDPEIAAEAMAALRPLLPVTIPAILRSVFLGVIPIIFDWGVEPLDVPEPVTEDDEDGLPDVRTIPAHVHYVAAHEVWPGDAWVEVGPDDEVDAVIVGSERYPSDRALVAVWEKSFGEFIGEATRRRQFAPWLRKRKKMRGELRYFERSVDPPRIVYCPEGEIDLGGGDKRPALDIGVAAILALRAGGAAGLPAKFDENGNRVWEVVPLDLPERSSAYAAGIERENAELMLAGLTPPSAVVSDVATFAGAKVPGDLYVETVERIGRYVAEVLSVVVRTPHLVAHPDEAPPVVRCRALPKAKRKMLLEVFTRIVGNTRVLADKRVYTVAEQVDAERLMDELAVPFKAAGKVAREPMQPESVAEGVKSEVKSESESTTQPGGPGPEREPASERDERRDAARTEEGEESTGR